MRATAVVFLLVLAAAAVLTPTGASAYSSLVFTHATIIDVRTAQAMILPDSKIGRSYRTGQSQTAG